MTWFHYPVALIPVALASVARAEGATFRWVAVLLAGAFLAATAALVAPIIMWVAVALVLWTAHLSATSRAAPQ